MESGTKYPISPNASVSPHNCRKMLFGLCRVLSNRFEMVGWSRSQTDGKHFIMSCTTNALLPDDEIRSRASNATVS